MDIEYTIIETEGKPSSIWAELGDGRALSIPMDEANSDYQRYLNHDKVEHLTEIVADETPTK